ncbi:MAG: nuclear transport factor 2 family protein [Sphingomonas bacterium]|nr:nuclear transport factor 2 family protein [Sphingomonas bacterium]
MRLKMLVVALALAGLGAPATAQRMSTAAASVAIPREAAAVVDAFHAALGRGDTDGAAALLDPNVLIYESGRAERSKAEYAAHHLPADAIFAKAIRRTVTRRSGRADGSSAWLTTEATSKGKYKDKAIDSVGVETMVLKRIDQTWRIVHIHWSSANAK